MIYKCPACNTGVRPRVYGDDYASVYEWYCPACHRAMISEIRRISLGEGTISEARRRMLLKEGPF